MNYILAQDLGFCDVMLEALSSTAFSTTVDFTAFKLTSRAEHVPNNDDKGWKKLYRRVREDGRACLVSSFANLSDAII